MTAVEVASIARQRVDRIKTGVEVIWQIIVESYEARDWQALGYSTWDEMCTREFGTSRLALPREDRAETVQSLRAAGLSLRAIESATGLGKSTVQRELAGVPDGTPAAVLVDHTTGEVLDTIDADMEANESPYVEPVPPRPIITGTDGKSYTPPASRKPPRKPLADVAKTRGFALRQSMDSVLRLTEDDRYSTNEKQVADVLRGHLLYVAETVAAVLDQLP